MALEATHIRIALDTQSKIRADKIDQYLSGTIYPDSRYITKIERTLTHGRFLDEDDLPQNDFQKGWYIHLLVDRIQKGLHDEHLEHLFYKTSGGKNFAVYSAIKIVQDIQDFETAKIQKYIDALDYIETPNGERHAEVKEYNKIFQDVYDRKEKLNVEDYKNMWLLFGLEKGLVDDIINNAEKFLGDSSATREIQSIYPMTLKGINKTLEDFNLS